jgi:nicotinamide-nucleotide amidase
MKLARILAIGDELTLGRTVDSNSAHIARFLSDRGLRVAGVQVVGDGAADIERALRAAVGDAALVVVSGGLGPTDDDRTRHALAAAMAVPLTERARAWAAIRAWYSRQRPGMEIPVSNRRQALLPRGAQLLANDRGTAPGILALVAGCPVACLPGVPHEMAAMLDRLGRRLGALVGVLRPPVVAELHLAGIGESSAQSLIGGLLSERRPQVGITVSELGHITLRVVGTALEVSRRRAQLRRRLAGHVLPAPGIAASLVAILTRRGQSITTAESCSCGHAAVQLGAIPGASRILRQALVAYHPAVKRRLLGVPAALLRGAGVVSEAVAARMALGARRWAGADIAISTTGVAGPGGGGTGHAVGTVCFAVADRHGVVARTVELTGNRERIQRRAAGHALLLAYQLVSGQLRTAAG